MPEELPLRDIIALEPSWWPPAPMFWLLALAGLLILAGLVHWLRGVLQYKYARLQRAALRELESIQLDKNVTDQAFAREISSLLKRVALQRFPDRNLANLSGDQWLAFLDNAVDESAFKALRGENLDAAQYRLSAKLDQVALVDAAAQWIRAI